jgi:tRNA U34 5-carboxymethylaminomethyl modifying GTPase MnmE/TrmE
MRALLNGKLVLAQAEAVADLIRARSDAQLRGASE